MVANSVICMPKAFCDSAGAAFNIILILMCTNIVDNWS